MTGVPAEQLRALIRLLWPAEITPTAKRQLEALCEQAAPTRAEKIAAAPVPDQLDQYLPDGKVGLSAVAPGTTNHPDLVTHHDPSAEDAE